MLIDHGADVNLKQCDGQTPLDIAVAQQFDNVITDFIISCPNKDTKINNQQKQFIYYYIA